MLSMEALESVDQSSDEHLQPKQEGNATPQIMHTGYSYGTTDLGLGEGASAGWSCPVQLE